MIIGSSARVPILPAPSGTAGLSANASRNFAPTEVPPSSTVAPAPEVPNHLLDGAKSNPSDVSRNVTIDPGTREVVLQAISKQSGEVVRQVPDQALLRIRAYAREMRRESASAVSPEPVGRSA